MSRAGDGKKKTGGPARERLKRLRRLMRLRKLDALLITSMDNIRYMTGFTGSAASAVVSLTRACFLTDGRYLTQAGAEVEGYKIKLYKDPLKDAAHLINSFSVNRLGIEAEHLTHAAFKNLRGALQVSSVRSTSGLVEELRLIKDDVEIHALRGAAGIVEKALEEVMTSVRAGMTEWEVAVELEHRFKVLGSEKNAFDFIVASGKRGSLPHGLATDKKIRNREMVTIDCGTRWKGYYSDCTRTFVVGRPTARQREVYQVVLDAQKKAIDAIGPGVKAGDVDAAARDHITQKGYGKYFGHSTGHGVGLAVHEEPRLAQGSVEKLQEGMLVTAEPGIYIPDWGGVRIEDMVLVTGEGAEVLTGGITKELLSV